jgi:uncharacterized protein YjbJ (UPF0337 family)
MNQAILEGKWRRLRGNVKGRWGKLTGNNLKRIEGRVDQMIGLLQERKGYTRQRAEEELDHYLDRFGNTLGVAAEEIQARAKSAVEEIQENTEKATEKAAEMSPELAKTGKRRPWIWLGAGAVVLLLAGKLILDRQDIGESLDVEAGSAPGENPL